MDVVKLLKEIPWCTEPWEAPQVSEEARQLLRECCAALPSEPDVDLRDVIENSKQFPVPFPIDTVRLEKLQAKCPLERLKRNVESTYPLVHERVLVIMANFILFKRQHGSEIEKQFYKNMTIPQLIDRILKKRAVSFMKAKDHYKLLSGEKGVDGWDAVGTKRQTPPLILENCLSYDEMKISALVNVSGYTECINDGSRNNAGLVREDGVENEAVIIGVIGPRFKRRKRMEYEDIIVNEDQNYEQNGYGCGETECYDVAIRAWRKMWGEFYQIPLYTDEELNARVKVPASSAARVLSERWVRARGGGAFHNTAYTRRLRLTADCALADAEQRATQRGAYAYVNVIGAGLGVWKFSNHQLDVYILTFLDRINFFLQHGMLNHVSDVNLAFIQPDKNVADLFQNGNKSGDVESPKKIFFECVIHPRGGINVQLENRPPSSKLSGEHEGKLLILTYPWDSNAHPVNEFWLGKLTTSGDPAAACSTQVSELHNAHINPVVCGNNTRVATVNGIIPLAQHCAEAYK